MPFGPVAAAGFGRSAGRGSSGSGDQSPGASTVAAHSLRALDDGRTHVELWIDQRGVVGRAIGVLVRRMTRRYLRMEAEGLKRRSEALAVEHDDG